MTWLPWLGVGVAVLPMLALGLRAVGGARWAALIRTHTRVLEAGRVGVAGRRTSASRYDAHKLEGRLLNPPALPWSCVNRML